MIMMESDTLIPHSEDSQPTPSIPTTLSAELASPVWAKTEPKTTVMATIEVTLGMKYATRYAPVNRTCECSRNASTRARNSIGTVDRNQISKVLSTECQNTESSSSQPYCLSPTKRMSPMPSQSWKDRYREKTTGKAPKTAKST